MKRTATKARPVCVWVCWESDGQQWRPAGVTDSAYEAGRFTQMNGLGTGLRFAVTSGTIKPPKVKP